MAREKQINFRVSKEEAVRFVRVADHYGIALASMIRMLVKREDVRLDGGVTTLVKRKNSIKKVAR